MDASRRKTRAQVRGIDDCVPLSICAANTVKFSDEMALTGRPDLGI
jgi:hypothetical protein